MIPETGRFFDSHTQVICAKNVHYFLHQSVDQAETGCVIVEVQVLFAYLTSLFGYVDWS